jgi:hypothetical protein
MRRVTFLMVLLIGCVAAPFAGSAQGQVFGPLPGQRLRSIQNPHLQLFDNPFTGNADINALSRNQQAIYGAVRGLQRQVDSITDPVVAGDLPDVSTGHRYGFQTQRRYFLTLSAGQTGGQSQQARLPRQPMMHLAQPGQRSTRTR